MRLLLKFITLLLALCSILAAPIASADNQRPITHVGSVLRHGHVGEPMIFDASESFDPDGNIVSYTWEFGDGTTERLTQPVTTHRYNQQGNFNVVLTVEDNNGKTSSSVLDGNSPGVSIAGENFCIGDGFCWENPWPIGETLNTVWAFSGTNVFAAGNSGVLLQFNGSNWIRRETNTRVDLSRMWANDPNNIWFSGGYRWNGSTIVPPQLSAGVAGTGDIAGINVNDVWMPVLVNGTRQGLVRFNGTSWSAPQLTEAAFYFIGNVQGKLYALSDRGLYRYTSGSSWTFLSNSGAPDGVENYRRMWGSSDTDIWLVGANRVKRWNGTSWGNIPGAPTIYTFIGVWGTSPSDVFLLGDSFCNSYRWNGSTFTSIPYSLTLGFDNNMGAIHGTGPNDVWGVGNLGAITHWNGSQWSGGQGIRDFSSPSKQRIFGSGTSAVWTPAQHWDGGSWSFRSSYVDRPHNSMFSFSVNDIWVGGYTGVSHFDGNNWTTYSLEFGTFTNLDSIIDIWGVNSNDLWALKGVAGKLYHWNGNTWSIVSNAPVSSMIWGASPNQIWTAGTNSANTEATNIIYFYNGSSWVPQYNGAANVRINRLWGSSASDVWAVGTKAGTGLILRYNGTTWSQVSPAPTIPILNDIWGRAANDVWLVGEEGIVLHWDGTQFEIFDGGTTRRFTSVWASPLEVWIASGNAILRRKLSTTTPHTLTTNIGSGQGRVDIVPHQTSFASGSEATLVAVPALSQVFTGWSGCSTGNQNPLTITMNTNKSCTANFAPGYVLTVELLGLSQTIGTVTISPDLPTYPHGTSVTLTAATNPESGCSSFLDWNGNPAGSQNPLTITMNSDKHLAARFITSGAALLTRSVSNSSAGMLDGIGSTSGSTSSINCDSDTSLPVSVNNGFSLIDIVNNGQSKGPQNPYALLDILSNHNVRAYFRQNGDLTPPVMSSFTVTNSAGQTLPTGSTLSGLVAFQTQVTDSGGVYKVEYYAGTRLLATVYYNGNSPTSGALFEFDTSTLANGNYTLSAKAYDTALNSTISAGFLITSSNQVLTPVIITSSPIDGFIDPLEDRDASNANTLFGVNEVFITFSTPVKSATSDGIGGLNFRVQCLKNGNTASDLQTNGVPTVNAMWGSGAGPYRLLLSKRLCLGAWTEISAKNIMAPGGNLISPTGNRVLLGSLPMDLTQDGRVLGDDVSRWLQIYNDTYNPGALLKPLVLDQKRNGIITGEDISRAIQLLNGIGTFRNWNGYEMGPKP